VLGSWGLQGELGLRAQRGACSAPAIACQEPVPAPGELATPVSPNELEPPPAIKRKEKKNPNKPQQCFAT